MKSREKFAIFVFLAVLVSFGFSASADESKIGQISTALSNTTVSGYVSSSATFSLPVEHKKPLGFYQWLHNFFDRVNFLRTR
jgi:hypothetical protein